MVALTCPVVSPWTLANTCVSNSAILSCMSSRLLHSGQTFGASVVSLISSMNYALQKKSVPVKPHEDRAYLPDHNLAGRLFTSHRLFPLNCRKQGTNIFP